jgi:hypothetical protein
MLTFEYLKTNPQKNATRIKLGWRELFTDPECPHGVKAELLELDKLIDEISDAILYFHSVYMIRKFTCPLNYKGKPIQKFKSDEWFGETIKNKKIIDALYSYVQMHPETKEQIDDLFMGFDSVTTSAIYLELTAQELFRIIEHCISRGILILDESTCLRIINPAIGSATRDNMYRSVHWTECIRYLSLDFLRTCDMNTLYRCQELFRDVPTPPLDNRYNSYGELERAHEARTEAEVQRMLQQNPAKIIYDPVFKDIVKAHGYTLPATRNDMIRRGAEAHNCVATYADKQVRNNSIECTRLVFAPNTVTAELYFHCEYDLIVMVECRQYKGRYNKEVERPIDLTKLRIALTGQPANILYAYEEEITYA